MLANAFMLALREIRRNLLRSLLTTLGIVIGVAAVIIMVTLGNGATVQVSSQIASLGSNLVIVSPGQGFGPRGTVAAPNFKQADLKAVRNQVPGARAVAPMTMSPRTLVYGNNNWSSSVRGSDESYFTVGNWQLTSGRAFTESEVRGGKAVCVIGATVRSKLYGGQEAVGTRLRLGNFSCEVIGVLAAKGQSAMGTDQDDVVAVPLRVFQRRIAGNDDISQIILSLEDDTDIESTKENLARLMRERRHISPGEEDNFNVMDTKQIAEAMTGTTKVLTMLLSAVAAISLLVGGIGIMNIMLVSVTERTREIGIRLAIGALEREVLMQFLVEAVVLSSLGGIAGIVLAVSSSLLIARAMEVPFVLDYGIVLMAFGFSAAVGVVFGYFPARRAARLDPIDALRHE